MGFLVTVWNPLRVLVKHGTELWIYSSDSQPGQCWRMANLWVPPAPGSLSQNHLGCNLSADSIHKLDLRDYTTDVFREEQKSSLKTLPVSMIAYEIEGRASLWSQGEKLPVAFYHFKFSFPWGPIKCYPAYSFEYSPTSNYPVSPLDCFHPWTILCLVKMLFNLSLFPWTYTHRYISKIKILRSIWFPWNPSNFKIFHWALHPIVQTMKITSLKFIF